MSTRFIKILTKLNICPLPLSLRGAFWSTTLHKVEYYMTIKVPTYNINEKHPNEDNEDTINRICKVEDNE
jgi:hypothetical protein